MEMLRLQFEMEVLRASMAMLLEANNIKEPDLDAGKWYNRKSDK